MAILDDICATMHAQSDGADVKFVQVKLLFFDFGKWTFLILDLWFDGCSCVVEM